MKSLLHTFGFRKSNPALSRQKRGRLNLDGIEKRYSLYAVGDVHGCLRELHAIEAQIREDVRVRQRFGIIIYLGDYVDRGPQSAAVLDHLCQAPPNEFRRLPLCGNHDDMFLRFFRNPARHLNWLEMGGEETLKSYSIDIGRYLGRRKDMAGLRAIMKERIPEQHLAFLDKLYISLKVGKFLFVHAGIKPGLPIQQQTDHDLMWIREPFLSEGSGSPLTVVHGHTMTMEPVFGNKRIGIDTGAYMTGRLSAVRIFNDVCEVL